MDGLDSISCFVVLLFGWLEGAAPGAMRFDTVWKQPTRRVCVAGASSQFRNVFFEISNSVPRRHWYLYYPIGRNLSQRLGRIPNRPLQFGAPLGTPPGALTNWSHSITLCSLSLSLSHSIPTPLYIQTYIHTSIPILVSQVTNMCHRI